MALYAQITNVSIQSSAAPGSAVPISVTIKNIYSLLLSFWVTAGATEFDLNLQFGGGTLAAGQSLTVTSSFIMPQSTNATINIFSWWYGGDAQYHLDDQTSKVVTLSGGAPQGSLTIENTSIPTSAAAGSAVNVSVDVKNNYSIPVLVHVLMTYNNVYMSAIADQTIPVGVTVRFTGTFTMPSVSADVGIGVFSIISGISKAEAAAANTVALSGGGGGEVGPFTVTVTKPTAIPYSGDAGLVTISVSILPAGTFAATIQMDVYEGSILGGVGTLLDAQTRQVNFIAGQTQTLQFTHNSVYTSQSRRDVVVKVIHAGITIFDSNTSSDWDDVFYVTGTLTPATQFAGMSVNTAGGDYSAGANVLFTLAFDYKGIAQSAILTIIIGSGITFSPITTLTPTTIQLPARSLLTAVPLMSGTFTIPTTLPVGSYSIRAQVVTSDGVTDSDDMYGAFAVVSGGGDETAGYVLKKDYTYPLASTYYGQAEKSTVTWSVITPSFLLSDDKINQMITGFETKFAENGNHMLSIKLYEKSGLVKSDYIAYMTTTLESAAQALALGVNPLIFGIDDGVFIAILIVVGLIVGLIIVLVVRKDVSQFLFGNPETGTTGIMSVLPTLIMVMVMSMMMEMMSSAFAPEGTTVEKPVTEMVVKGAKKAIEVGGKVVGAVAPVVGGAVSKGKKWLESKKPIGYTTEEKLIKYEYTKE